MMVNIELGDDPELTWTSDTAMEHYAVGAWGQGFFAVNRKGHLVVQPDRSSERAIDLYEVVQGLRERDINPPLLLRFRDLLASRIRTLHDAFAAAIEDNGYQGDYTCVYPIKVNQQRHIVEKILDFGSAYGFGLEVGSKPELLAVLGSTAGRNDMPIVCNGFKDSEFIETVILAAKLGRKIIPVVEKYSELKLIVHHAERYGVRPSIGVRVKLSARGAGRWEDSGGLRSKFGLYITELLDALDYLADRDMADCLCLLHCHIGSQVNDIRSFKNAVSELAHVYVELRRAGAGLCYLDVGGGLGVDYDGSQSAFESSVNYTLEEYAADVVYRVGEVCDGADVPHPTLVSESGRALTAYHAVLVCDVLGSTSFDAMVVPDSQTDALAEVGVSELSQPVRDLFAAHEAVRAGAVEEAFHDAAQAHEEALNLFRLGYMSLRERSLAERLYWVVCASVLEQARERGELQEPFDVLAAQMSDIYFCNMSIFQSLPDSWAIDQVFPIVPIHRLNEQPTRRAILADITCDSEGKIYRFVGDGEARGMLDVHALKKGKPYYLAVLLAGAYQEILGDLHNLLGDTHAVHIALDEEGEWEIEELVAGDTVREVLRYVQFEPERLMESVRREVERAVRRRVLTVRESRQLLSFYQDGLDGYTYLEEA